MKTPLLAALGSGVMLFACSDAQEAPTGTSSAPGGVGEVAPVVHRAALQQAPLRPARTCRLVDPKLIYSSSAPVLGPALSPDGLWVAFSGPKFAQVSLLQVPTGHSRPVVAQEGVGWRIQWMDLTTFTLLSPTGIGYSATVDSNSLSPLNTHASIGKTALSPVSGASYYHSQDRIWATYAASDSPLPISPASHKAYNPRLSPDGAFLLWEDLTSGLWLQELRTDQIRPVGAGNHPVFSADSRLLFFDRSTDDGLQIQTSDLWVYDLAAHMATPVTATDDRLEMYPSVTQDASALAYADGNNLWSATLVCEDPSDL